MDEARLNTNANIRIIAVASGKGGVGKSTVAANLAMALHMLGFRAGIMDADIYGFSIPRLLNAQGQPRTDEEGIRPLQSRGLEVMSMGFFVPIDEPVIWRGPLLMKAVDQFINDVAWSPDLDYLIIDLPPGTGDVPLTIAQRLPRAELILVTLPEISSVEVASRAGNMATKTDMVILGVVENMSYLTCPNCDERIHPFGKGGGEGLARSLGVPLLAQLPMDVNNSASENERLLVDRESSAAGKAILDLAERIASVEVSTEE